MSSPTTRPQWHSSFVQVTDQLGECSSGVPAAREACPDERGVSEIEDAPELVGAPVTRFGHQDAAEATLACFASQCGGRGKVDLQCLQVPVVDADDVGTRFQRDVELCPG